MADLPPRPTRISDPAAIRRQLDGLPKKTALRSRDVADRLGVSEAALVAATLDPVRLRRDPAGLLKRVSELGDVLALTRNDAAVHEKVGRYGELQGEGEVCGIYGQIDLRLFFRHWHHLFGVPGCHGRAPSLQVFDPSGTAVHKIHLRPESEHAAFERLIQDLADDDQSDSVELAPPVVPPPTRADDEVETERVRSAWSTLENVHEFHLLLREFGVGREQALRLVGAPFARRVDRLAHRELAEHVRATHQEVMVFVANPGCVQIYTGPLERLELTGAWWNVLDPGFNLHLREDLVQSSWVVHKPTERGGATSLELFDPEGRLILTVFGRRDKGASEDPAWRALTDTLPNGT